MGTADVGLVGPEKINPGFIDEILVQMDEEGLEVTEMFDSSTIAMLRIALNNLVQDVDPEQLQDNQMSPRTVKHRAHHDEIGKGEIGHRWGSFES